MRKLIRAVIVIAMVTSLMIAQTFTAYAGSAVINVTADVTEAEPGDTVNFTVSLGPVSDMGTMQMVLDIPEGLTYVSKSGKLAGGLKRELGFDFADFTEKSLMINGGASAADYSSSSDTVICTFSCTVDNGFKGKAEVGLTDLEFYSCETWVDHTGDYSVSEAVISVGNDDGQGASAGPGKSSDTGKSSGSSGSNGSQSQSGNDTSVDQNGDNGEPADDPAQAAEADDQASEDTKDAADSETLNDLTTDGAEEEHSSTSLWMIAVAAVLIIAAIIIVFVKRKKQ